MSTITRTSLPAKAAPLDQSETPYLDALVEHRDSSPVCFNVPAHKAGQRAAPRLLEVLGAPALGLDVPPIIPGIDCGEQAPLDRSQALAAAAWGASRTWFIQHGGSGAIHAAMLAASRLGNKILIQRNVHASAITGLILSGLDPVFMVPEVDDDLGAAHCLSRRTLAGALGEHPDAAAVFVLSPTYFGTAADVSGIVADAHSAGKPVIVDEAWGGHFAFSTSLPEAAIHAGADLVISSTHKMVGSLTQSAMLHLGGAPLGFDAALVDRAVMALQSTSPSGLLAGSLDAARAWIATCGEDAIEHSIEAARDAHFDIRAVGLDVLDYKAIGRYAIADVDLLRLCIDCRPADVDGRVLGAALRAQNVHPELVGANVLVAIVGLGEGHEQLQLLAGALSRALRDCARIGWGRTAVGPLPALGPRAMTPREAWLSRSEQVPLAASAGRISADTVSVYPPGIPNFVPGELITGAVLAYVQESLAAGAHVRGLAGGSEVSVVAE
jgi:lysine decarboxylase